MRANRRRKGGKIYRRWQQLPGRGDPDFAESRDFIGFFVMARRLLILEPRR
jgi:hypothetical protein